MAKVRKLEAITVERGASPAEAAAASVLARRLLRQIRRRRDRDPALRAAAHAVLAPGVHVLTVPRTSR